MTPDIGFFTVEKAGSTSAENEDRAAWSVGSSAVRVAIADGATESSYSDLWADALVSAWIAGKEPEVGAGLLAAARATWSDRLPDLESLPWYAQAKLEEGSHATFAGLQLSLRGKRMRWRAQIVGDCEVFVLKPKGSLQLTRCEPLKSPADFGYHPDLLTTAERDSIPVPVAMATGRVRWPFEIWLCTDAFAAACLAAAVDGNPSWDDWAAAMEQQDSFRYLVDRWRSTGAMRNDDTTVCRIRAAG